MNKKEMDNSYSSSDEDDPYTNSVARLRALKEQRFERALIELCPKNIEQEINGKEINDKEINGKEINGKEINDKETNGKKINGKEINDEDIYSAEINDGMQTNSIQTRSMRFPANLEYDVEFVTEFQSTSDSYNNDVIALSDDEAYIEDDNYEINIKMHWRSSRIDRLSMRRHDSFKRIFQHYADLEKVSVNEVLIMKKDKIVNHTDTPASLKLSIIDILDGGIVNPGMKSTSQDKSEDEDMCTIKVQTANKKQSLTIPLKKNERFKALFANCAKQLAVKENNLKFYFDGETDQSN